MTELRSPKFYAAIAAIVAVVVYANSLVNGFALDDVLIIQQNARAHDPLNLREIWLTPYWPVRHGRELGLYRPGAIQLFAVQWSLAGGAAWLFHALNVMLHAAVTVLTFALLRRLTVPAAAFVGALVFAVHPVHVEAVANVVGQAELVAAAAVFGACLVHLARPATGLSWPRRAALVALYFGALVTKESAVVLPALLVVCDFAQGRVRLDRAGIGAYVRALAVPLILLAATLSAYLLLRLHVMGGILGVDAAPSLPYLREEHRVLNALRAFPELIRLLVWPQELAADYMPNVLMPVDSVRPMVILGALLLFLVLVLAALTPWRPRIGFPAAWFIVSIVTVSNLFFPIGVLVAERTLYLPSVALSAAAAFGWAAVLARRESLRLAVPLLGVALLLMGARTWTRNPAWLDTTAVVETLLREHPHAYRAQWSLASLNRAGGRLAEADAHYRLTEQIYDRDAQLLAEYGEFLLMAQRFDDAILRLERALEINPRLAQAALVLAHAQLATTRYADAIETMRPAADLGIDRSVALYITAAAHEGLGETDEAIAAWSVGIRHDPRPSWRTWSFLARALARGGLEERAAVALDSAYAAARDDRARAIVGTIRQSVASGCYRGAATATCDPLGRWIGFAPAPRTNAPESSQ